MLARIPKGNADASGRVVAPHQQKPYQQAAPVLLNCPPVQDRTCLLERRGGPPDAQFGRGFLAGVLQELRRLEAPRPAPLL